MKTPLPMPLLSGALAALVLVPSLRADDSTVQMAPYEVVAPAFKSPMFETYEKLDNLFDAPWVDTGQSGALIEAIIWRHGYLKEHPSDQAMIYIESAKGGRVTAATTIYTSGNRLMANSWALGENVVLYGLTAADIGNRDKVMAALNSIRDVYVLAFELDSRMGSFFVGGDYDLFGRTYGERDSAGLVGEFIPGVLGSFTAMPDVGEGPGLPPRDVGLQAYIDGLWPTFYFDRYRQPESVMLDSVYRALSDPDKAGKVSVSLSQMQIARMRRDGSPGRLQTVSVIAFDWDGVHYVYRPYHGTVGSQIARNPVTGLPFLYVKDGGLMESIYFCATYLQEYPGEKAVVVPGDLPAAAYTFKGHVALFCPSLNHFAELKPSAAGAIDHPEALAGLVQLMKTGLAAHSALPAQVARGKPKLLTEGLAGDTADSEMRRAFLAFDAAGLTPRFRGEENKSTLTFSWQGVNYVYGADQRLSRL